MAQRTEISPPGQPSYFGVPLDTVTIPKNLLNIDHKERSNLLPWNGQFSPQLIEVLLGVFAACGNRILDPFVGSGTVLYEAARRGLAAFGSDINPAACKMANIYSLINIDLAARRRLIEHLDDLLDQLTPNNFPLFSAPRDRDQRSLEELLGEFANSANDPHVRGMLEAMMVLLNLGEGGIDERAVKLVWKKLRTAIWSLPFSEAPIELANCDARSLPLCAECVDLVITSPPYINVFNYHQQYRQSVEAMGWNLLKIARSEIGANRKHRQNRFLTVIQYCLDMHMVLAELQRVCKPKARLIVVIGRESNVRKTRFLNGEITAHLAVRCAGLQLVSRQERVFRNRFGELIYEDILHFLTGPTQPSRASPGTIAEEALSAAVEYAPDGSQADLRDALNRIDQITPSPVYVTQKSGR